MHLPGCSAPCWFTCTVPEVRTPLQGWSPSRPQVVMRFFAITSVFFRDVKKNRITSEITKKKVEKWLGSIPNLWSQHICLTSLSLRNAWVDPESLFATQLLDSCRVVWRQLPVATQVVSWVGISANYCQCHSPRVWPQALLILFLYMASWVKQLTYQS